jgi:potassium channel subfamily K
MTILISDMGDTVVDKFKQWSSKLADFTVLPKEGVYQMVADKLPVVWRWFKRKKGERRLRRGFEVDDPAEPVAAEGSQGGADTDVEAGGPRNDGHEAARPSAADTPARKPSITPTPFTHSTLAAALATTIQHVVSDLHLDKAKTYSYEEWVEFTRLISAASKKDPASVAKKDDTELEEEDLGEWDWIGDDSPLISGLSESQWVLRRMCEALVRVEKRRVGEGTVDAEKVAKQSSRGDSGVGSVGFAESPRDSDTRRRNLYMQEGSGG